MEVRLFEDVRILVKSDRSSVIPVPSMTLLYYMIENPEVQSMNENRFQMQKARTHPANIKDI